MQNTQFLSLSAIDNLFESFDDLKVLIIGDVMLDAYVWGKVERISPEAPVPVVIAQRREYRLGGAGNVILNVHALGATPIICSVIGQDAAGDTLIDELQKQQLCTDGLIRSTGRPTTIKERVMAGSQQVVRIDSETDRPIDSDEENQLIEKVKNLALGCQVILFQDYDKGVLTSRVIQAITDFANQQQIPTVVDPKKRNFMAYQQVTLFKPNLKELKEGMKKEFEATNDEALAAAVAQLKTQLNVNSIFVTLSERGVYIDCEDTKNRYEAHPRSIADVSGAGDTVISIAACCVALGQSAAVVAVLSNLGGGLVCEQLGVVPINKQRLREELKAMVLH